MAIITSRYVVSINGTDLPLGDHLYLRVGGTASVRSICDGLMKLASDMFDLAGQLEVRAASALRMAEMVQYSPFAQPETAEVTALALFESRELELSAGAAGDVAMMLRLRRRQLLDLFAPLDLLPVELLCRNLDEIWTDDFLLTLSLD